MKFLLDTNICIALMRGHTKAVRRLADCAPGECAVSTVTVYELFTGVAKSREPEREHGKVQRLLSLMRIVGFDNAAAECAATVRALLEKEGNVCGPYDLLLAGHALALALPLVTHNVREFARVRALQVDDRLA